MSSIVRRRSHGEKVTRQQTCVFRVDASLTVGTGHVMRCLTFASALRIRGIRCVFVCRIQPGELTGLIEKEGFEVLKLRFREQVVDVDPTESNVPHEAWLLGGWKADSKETHDAIAQIGVDWLVVDHYGIDARWERELRRRTGARVWVIDDLADRDHDADILLDQTLGRSVTHYSRLVADRCRLLLGPRFALLRDEFRDYRAASLNRRLKLRRVDKVLINLGGVDQQNLTQRVIKRLPDLPEADRLRVDVVMGVSAPHLEAVKSESVSSGLDIEVHVNAPDMARLMSESDFAIGAAGTTSWERLCLGLPSAMVVVAENQAMIASVLEKHGAAFLIDLEDFDRSLASAWRKLSLPKTNRRLSGSSAAMVDGRGATRVSEILESFGRKDE